MAETAVAAPSTVGAASVAQLSRAWLSALTRSADEAPGDPGGLPMDLASARAFLDAQSSALLAIVLANPFRPRQAAAIGHALVQADFVNADVLGRSLRVLIMRLPELLLDPLRAGRPLAGVGTGAGAAIRLDGRIAEVTGALANGYVRALRDRTLAEQESIRQAELDSQRIISDQLRHAATHDPLTGLPNRSAIFGRLAVALEPGQDTRVGLCYLDLDGFKEVNDSCGHEAGDELLVTVARRIGETAQVHGGLAGRIGGDEFIVVAEMSPGVRGLIDLAAGILGEVNRPIGLRAGQVRISACAGIAECAAGSPRAATLVADADDALYRAKAQGPGTWVLYDGTAQGLVQWQGH